MIITTNPTQRKSIATDKIVLSLNRKSIPMTFDCQIPELVGLGLPLDAKVYVEAYHQAVYMRFDFGSVGAFRPPGDRQLSDFYDGAPVRFRIKVVDINDQIGRILADADDVRPSRPDEDVHTQTLVPIHLVGGMGQQIWRVEWDNNDPILELNQAQTGIKEAISSNSMYSSLVMPAVFREISSKVFGEDLEGETATRWRLMVSRFQSDPFPDEDDDAAKSDWLNVATHNYCEHFRFLDAWHRARSEHQDGAPRSSEEVSQ
jgi:hypothetical protein